MGLPGSTGAHDVGGQLDLLSAPLDRAEKDYTLWERRVHALQLALAGKRLLTVDEMRRAIEGLSAEAQEQMSYYEKWAAALTTISIERGIITQADLEAELGPTEQPPETARFQPGDLVRVRTEDSAVRWRKPHLRTPGYIFGLVGTVERESQGLFGNPEALAYRHSAAKQPLYRVRFSQLDVWEGYTGSERDTVDVEIYQPWLEPATQQDLDVQRAARAARQAVYKAHSMAQCDHSHEHTHHEHHHHDHSHGHGHEEDGEGAHVHEERHVVEQVAVEREGEDDQERRRIPEALIRAMIAKGVVTADELRRGVELMDSRLNSGAGARLVARAWVDPEFKKRLLQDAGSAAAELGIAASVYPTAATAAPGASASAATTTPSPAPMAAIPLRERHGTILTVVENTPTVHNLIVCTLCSCYPISVLGMSPAWYKSRAYRARAVREPRGVLREFGTELPDSVQVAVHDSTADNRYLVLPLRPEGTEGWTEEQLQALVTRDTLIGVSVCRVPDQATSTASGA